MHDVRTSACMQGAYTLSTYVSAPLAAGLCSYPHALYFLDLLQTPEFRAKIANPAYKELAHTQQFYFWQVGAGALHISRAQPWVRACLLAGGARGGGASWPPALQRWCAVLGPQSCPCLAPALQHARANRMRQKMVAEQRRLANWAGVQGDEAAAAEAAAAGEQQLAGGDATAMELDGKAAAPAPG